MPMRESGPPRDEDEARDMADAKLQLYVVAEELVATFNRFKDTVIWATKTMQRYNHVVPNVELKIGDDMVKLRDVLRDNLLDELE